MDVRQYDVVWWGSEECDMFGELFVYIVSVEQRSSGVDFPQYACDTPDIDFGGVISLTE